MVHWLANNQKCFMHELLVGLPLAAICAVAGLELGKASSRSARQQVMQECTREHRLLETVCSQAAVLA